MKLNVYEYTIKDSKLGNYKGSYTVVAGSTNESILKNRFKSKLVDSFNHTTNKTIEIKEPKQIYKLTNNVSI